MKRWLIGTSLFVAGLFVGACLRGPRMAFAQARTKTTVQAVSVATIEAFGKPKTPATLVTGKVEGFSCTSAHCFVLVAK